MTEKNASCAYKTTIGGQALIEGIMMKGPKKIATVILKSDGSRAVREEAYTPAGEKNRLWKLPILRGVVAFGSSIKQGVSQVMFSAEQLEIEEEPGRFERWLEKKVGSKKAEKFFMNLAVVLGIALPVLLFIFIPTVLAAILDFFGLENIYFLRSLAEGLLRLLIFLGFIYFSSKMKDMKRVYGFHGAEHKAVYCYEAGEELTVENVRRFSRFHPRCGTSFLFLTMIVSILVFSFITVDHLVWRLVLRLLLLPLVAGLAYEATRLAGRYDTTFTRILRAPGLALQRLTTVEPDDEMISVAIDALERVIPEEKGADQW
jgi:uncharacterized protein YqhQ